MDQVQQHIVFLTGAGISAESGLSTFRGKGGLWKDKKMMYLASSEALYYDTEKFLDFYNARRLNLSKAEPSRAHALIADLEKRHMVTVITQNVDNLHERAGSSTVIHLHGELSKVCSSNNRADPRFIREYPLDKPIKLGDDAGDGSQLRPYVVLFGEYVSGIKVAQDLVSTADIVVVIGTSLSVAPASGLVKYARHDVPKFVIDPDEIPACGTLGYKHIKAGASEGMSMLLEELDERCGVTAPGNY